MTRPGAAANFSLFVRATPDSIVRGLPRGYEIAGEFYDAAVSGTDPIAERPGFKAAIAAFANAGSHRQQRRPVPYVSATNAGPTRTATSASGAVSLAGRYVGLKREREHYANKL